MKKTAFILGGLALVFATPAMAGSDCLQIGRIYGWDALNNQTMIVSDRSHDKFKVDFLGSCVNLKFRQTLAFKSPGGSQLSCLSSGDSVMFRTPGIGRETCSVKSVSAYTPEMEKADKAAKSIKESNAGSDSGSY